MRRPSLIAGLAIILGGGCGSPTGSEITGTWGGPEANLTLAASGGTVEYGCGAGTIDSAWNLSTDGLWSATGQHFTGGGPDPIEGRAPHPASYSGRLRGSRLTFTVTLPDLNQTLGPFALERGKTNPLFKCL